MNPTFDQWAALLLGIGAVLFSVKMALLFWRIKKPLTRLLAWLLLSEAYLAAATLAFTIGAFTGSLERWPEWVQSTIRLTMFSFAAITTYNLHRYSKTNRQKDAD